MKYNLNLAVAVLTASGILISCHSGGYKEPVGDTSLRTHADTTVIPGTPGPAGTEPRPGDTTQAHRDSLKRASDIADTSGKNRSNQ